MNSQPFSFKEPTKEQAENILLLKYFQNEDTPKHIIQRVLYIYPCGIQIEECKETQRNLVTYYVFLSSGELIGRTKQLGFTWTIAEKHIESTILDR